MNRPARKACSCQAASKRYATAAACIRSSTRTSVMWNPAATPARTGKSCSTASRPPSWPRATARYGSSPTVPTNSSVSDPTVSSATGSADPLTASIGPTTSPARPTAGSSFPNTRETGSASWTRTENGFRISVSGEGERASSSVPKTSLWTRKATCTRLTSATAASASSEAMANSCFPSEARTGLSLD